MGSVPKIPLFGPSVGPLCKTPKTFQEHIFPNLCAVLTQRQKSHVCVVIQKYYGLNVLHSLLSLPAAYTYWGRVVFYQLTAIRKKGPVASITCGKKLASKHASTMHLGGLGLDESGRHSTAKHDMSAI